MDGFQAVPTVNKSSQQADTDYAEKSFQRLFSIETPFQR